MITLCLQQLIFTHTTIKKKIVIRVLGFGYFFNARDNKKINVKSSQVH